MDQGASSSDETAVPEMFRAWTQSGPVVALSEHPFLLLGFSTCKQ